jgi:hypothetical protein
MYLEEGRSGEGRGGITPSSILVWFQNDLLQSKKREDHTTKDAGARWYDREPALYTNTMELALTFIRLVLVGFKVKFVLKSGLNNGETLGRIASVFKTRATFLVPGQKATCSG